MNWIDIKNDNKDNARKILEHLLANGYKFFSNDSIENKLNQEVFTVYDDKDITCHGYSVNSITTQEYMNQYMGVDDKIGQFSWVDGYHGWAFLVTRKEDDQYYAKYMQPNNHCEDADRKLYIDSSKSQWVDESHPEFERLTACFEETKWISEEEWAKRSSNIGKIATEKTGERTWVFKASKQDGKEYTGTYVQHDRHYSNDMTYTVYEPTQTFIDESDPDYERLSAIIEKGKWITKENWATQNSPSNENSPSTKISKVEVGDILTGTDNDWIQLVETIDTRGSIRGIVVWLTDGGICRDAKTRIYPSQIFTVKLDDPNYKYYQQCLEEQRLIPKDEYFDTDDIEFTEDVCSDYFDMVVDGYNTTIEGMSRTFRTEKSLNTLNKAAFQKLQYTYEIKSNALDAMKIANTDVENKYRELLEKYSKLQEEHINTLDKVSQHIKIV